MHINDRIIGLLAILGGIGVIAGTLGFREIPGQQFGSAFFPRLIGGAMILCGIAFVATAWSARPERLIRIGEMLRGVSGLKVAAVLVAVVVWIALSPYLGFVVTTALLITALAVLAGRASPCHRWPPGWAWPSSCS